MASSRKQDDEPTGIFDTPLDGGDAEESSGFDDDNEQRPIYASFGDDPAKDEKAPRQHSGPREPLTDLVTLAWGGVGTVLVTSQADIPVGRVLQFQAPMAGNKLDALIAGTWLDSLLQPLAKRGGELADVGSLILLPLLIGAYEREPEMMQPMVPVIRQVVRASLVDMVPMMKKRKAEEARAAKAMADLSDVLDFEVEPGADPIDAILGAFFFMPVEPDMEPGDSNG